MASPLSVFYHRTGANCGGIAMANVVMFYKGTGVDNTNLAVQVQSSGQGNTVTGISDTSTYWLTNGYSGRSKESIFTWDNWNQTNTVCPWTMTQDTPPAKKVIVNMPPRYMWGQALLTGTDSSKFNGGTFVFLPTQHPSRSGSLYHLGHMMTFAVCVVCF
jgi:hypothetical protein